MICSALRLECHADGLQSRKGGRGSEREVTSGHPLKHVEFTRQGGDEEVVIGRVQRDPDGIRAGRIGCAGIQGGSRGSS